MTKSYVICLKFENAPLSSGANEAVFIQLDDRSENRGVNTDLLIYFAHSFIFLLEFSTHSLLSWLCSLQVQSVPGLTGRLGSPVLAKFVHIVVNFRDISPSWSLRG